MVILRIWGALKTTFILAIAMAAFAAATLVLPAYAEDNPASLNLPQVYTCKTTIYMSSRWNKNNSITYSNDSLGYRKLICKTGREAFIFVKQPAQDFLFTLVNFSNEPITKVSVNMCGIVDNYCDK